MLIHRKMNKREDLKFACKLILETILRNFFTNDTITAKDKFFEKLNSFLMKNLELQLRKLCLNNF